MSYLPRAATSGELDLFRTPGQWSKVYAAIFKPTTVYTARVNQTFSTWDSVLEITYDTGSGTLANVLPDMTLLVGSTAGARDVGVCRIRSVDATKFYIGEVSGIEWANDLYLTVINDFRLWAKPVLISAGVPYIDGGIAYSDQHSLFDPVPIMGGNRVLKLTGASVSTTYDWTGCYVPDGSAVTAYATSSPTASGGSNLTTSAPTLQWNTTGWHTVYLTLTSAGGKQFFGVRYVYIWDPENMPADAMIGSNGQDVESGGWEFELTLFDNVDLDDVYEGALVVVFAEDHYGDTAQSIGVVTGCENILFTGWIGNETINWNPDAGVVRFVAYSAQYWMGIIPSYPAGVELALSTPAAWTQMQNLTVRLGLFHLLHWRTTCTRIMDVFLPVDSRISKEVSSLAGNLWGQVKEMGWDQIYARPGVDHLNRLFIETHPQLVPLASRTWATVMTITKDDWEGEIDFDRAWVNEVALVDMSGVVVDALGNVAAYFSLSPGRVYDRHGSLEIQSRLLLSSQGQLNVLAGLYRNWRNLAFKDIPIKFACNNRLIGCFPRQECSISIAAEDTPRGISYSGSLVPTRVRYEHDPENGYLHTEASFEAETDEGIGTTNIIPGSGDVSVPPTPALPRLPALPALLPSLSFPEPEGEKILVKDDHAGLMYTENADAVSPTWITVNAGMTSGQYSRINRLVVTPSGAVYVAYSALGTSLPFVAYAPAIGQPFTILYDAAGLQGLWGTAASVVVCAIACNPFEQDEVLIAVGAGTPTSQVKFIKGNGADGFFATGAVINTGVGSSSPFCSMSYGFGKWVFTGLTPGVATWYRLNSAGSGVEASAQNISDAYHHKRIGTTDKIHHFRLSANFLSTGNMATVTPLTSTVAMPFPADNFFDCDPAEGMFLMAYAGSGGRQRSSDGGATWTNMTVLPLGEYCFDYVRGSGVSSVWLAASGANIGRTDDFGDSFTSILGNYMSISPLPTPTIIQAVL